MTKKTYAVFSFPVLIACAVGLLGCATTVPISSNMNDDVLFGIKMNRQDAVLFEFVSNVQDGEMPVFKYEGSDGSSGTILINEGSILENMISDYMAVKFTKISGGGDAYPLPQKATGGEVQITFTLKDFIVRDWSTTESRRVSVKVTAALGIQRDGAEEVKTLIATAEKKHIGQAPHQHPYQYNGSERAAMMERLYYDKRNISPTRSDALSFCVNEANNKLLLQMNSFFEDINM
jgi:hypothetical protein